MVILFVLMVIYCVPPIVFFKSRPLTPPSYSASDVNFYLIIFLIRVVFVKTTERPEAFLKTIRILDYLQ